MTVELPGVLQEIAEAAGVDAALAIARARGGVRAWFPAAPRDDSWIVQLVGRAAADAICAKLAQHGTAVQFDIPLGPAGSYMAERRNRAIAMEAAIAGGLGTDAAARAVGAHRSTLKRFKRRRGEKDDDQPKLI